MVDTLAPTYVKSWLRPHSEEIKETNKRIKWGCVGYKTREWKLHCDLWVVGDLHRKPAYVSTSAFASCMATKALGKKQDSC